VSRLAARARRLLSGASSVTPEPMRRRLVAHGASLHPSRPSEIWRPWVNTALRNWVDVDRAHAEVTACGLLPHDDRPKDWDYLTALGSILDAASRSDPILEAGAARYSILLQWLYLYGYRDLRGIDLIYDKPRQVGPIRFEGMDLTRTTFADESFAAIACLSVIEHGVDLDAYLSEAARLLRPGGLLVTSTDFWCEPVDTAGREAYGVPIRIFSRADIEAFAERADGHGLRLVGPLDLRCEEKVVTWQPHGLSYTFVNVTLRKDARAGRS
jgi:SAM-dependent methyltransferase